MATKTIWHLSSNRWNSAITEYALSAARAYNLAGYHSVFTPLAGSPAEERATTYGLDTRSLRTFGIPEMPKLRTWEAEMKPDLIFVYGGPEAFLSKFLKAPVVRFRGQEIDASSMREFVRQRLATSHLRLLITPSRKLADAVKKVAPNGPPVIAVPLGCDSKTFAPQKKDIKPVVTILGRFDPVKGHSAGFRIFRRVLDHLQSLRPQLQVVGLPANLSEIHLQNEATKAGLTVGQDVIFRVEKVQNLAELLSETAVGFVPSIGSEVICRVAEEFLLCGTPVVAHDVGSLSECAFGNFGDSYRDEEMGGLQLAAWLRRSMGESAHEKAQRSADAARSFSLDAMADNLVEVARKVLS